MSTYTVKAVNLKTHSLGESDKILTLFSLEEGLIRAVAKGAKKTTGKLTSRSDLFQYNEMFLSRGKSLDIVTQASSIQSFSGLRKDLKKIYIASYWSELLLDTLEDREPHLPVFHLLIEGLTHLERGEHPEALLLYFELKLMDFAGYRPHLNSCGGCGVKEVEDQFFFNPDQGTLLCQSCREAASPIVFYMPLSPQTVQFVNRLSHASPEVAGRLKIGRELFGQAKRFTSAHLQYHLSGRHKKYSFMESLF